MGYNSRETFYKLLDSSSPVLYSPLLVPVEKNSDGTGEQLLLHDGCTFMLEILYHLYSFAKRTERILVLDLRRDWTFLFSFQSHVDDEFNIFRSKSALHEYIQTC